MAEKKRDQLYGGSYDQQIQDTYSQIQNRPAFNYDVDGDALYQQYKERYTQNAKNAMKDSMGQAAALTGGYGSSYAQGVGQQRYDETMRGLTDMIPTLEQNAYKKYQDQGAALQDRYNMLNSMAATEQATTKDAYSQLAQLIGTSGYQPTEDDLAKAGMTAEQANALRQMWMASNPQLAYYNGQLSPEDFYRLTGTWPAGYTPPSSGGGYTGPYTTPPTGEEVPMGSMHELTSYLNEKVKSGEITQREADALREEFGRSVGTSGYEQSAAALKKYGKKSKP